MDGKKMCDESCKPVDTLEEKCQSLRRDIKDIESAARVLIHYVNQNSEMNANIILAVRHLEDARTRFGKVIQYAGDGGSILDKK